MNDSTQTPDPNFDIILEKAILGGILLEKDAYAKVSGILGEADFHKPAHVSIYRACTALREEGIPIDLITTVDRLRKMAVLEQCGGAYYISELTSAVCGTANIEYHAALLVEAHIRRATATLGTAMASGKGEDVFELVASAKQELAAISDRFRGSSTQPLKNSFLGVLDNMMRDGNGMKGIPSGLNSLDTITLGWCNGDMIVVAARPSMGKTAFLLAMCRHAAIEQNIPTLIFSLEMSTDQLIERMAVSEAGLDAQKVRGGTLSDDEKQALMASTNRLYNAPIYINEKSGLSVDEMVTIVRREVKERGIGLVGIDYMQLMTANAGKGSQREAEISKISRSVKAAAKEMRVPIFALSQLNREAAKRTEKRPTLTDIRESGSIEQDADVVVFLHRPGYYEAHDAQGNAIDPTLCETIVAKQRNGPVGMTSLSFFPRFGNFTEGSASTF